MKSSLTIRRWFRRYAKLPIAAITVLIIIGECFFLAHTMRASERKQNETMQRIVEIVTLGVGQENRTLIESALGIGLDELDAKYIALCKGNTAVLSFPLEPTGCREGHKDFLHSLERRSLIGMSAYSVVFEVPRVENFGALLSVFFAAVLFSVSVYLILSRTQKKLSRDIIEPLEKNISEIDPENPIEFVSSDVEEIRNLYAEYARRLVEIKHLGIENEKNARLASIAQTTQMFAHDVRQPFSKMRSMIAQLAKLPLESEDAAFVNSCKTNVEKSLRHVEFMIQDMLDASPSPALSKAQVTWASILEDALDNVRENATEKKIVFCNRVESTLPIYVDSTKMGRVLTNILQNAVQASPNDGEIYVDLTIDSSKSHRLSIRNTGSYLSPQEQARVFSPFYSKGKKNGTGLGLAIAQNLVEAHGGVICIASNALPPWTEFTITLNGATDCEKNTISELKNPFKVTENPEVSIVEDDAIARQMWAMEMVDAKLNLFETPEQFWEAVRNDSHFLDRQDLLISDVHFGGLSETNGIDFALKLKPIFPRPIFLATDASIDPNSVSLFVTDVLPKRPMKLAELKNLTQAISL